MLSHGYKTHKYYFINLRYLVSIAMMLYSDKYMCASMMLRTTSIWQKFLKIRMDNAHHKLVGAFLLSFSSHLCQFQSVWRLGCGSTYSEVDLFSGTHGMLLFQCWCARTRFDLTCLGHLIQISGLLNTAQWKMEQHNLGRKVKEVLNDYARDHNFVFLSFICQN